MKYSRLALFLVLLFFAGDFSAKADAPANAPIHSAPATDVSGGGVAQSSRDELRNPPLTVECWVRLHDTASYNIIIASDPKSSSRHWEVFTTPKDGRLSAYLPGASSSDFTSDSSICDDKWHYVAFLYDTARIALYVDGNMVKEAAIAPAKGTPDPGGIFIGQLVEGGLGCNGLIQDVRISKGIRAISGMPAAPFTKDDTTLALWPLDGVPGRNVVAANSAAHSTTNAKAGITDAAAETRSATTGLNVPISQYATPRDSLREYETIPAAGKDELTASNGWPDPATFKTWTRSHGGPGSTRYSALDQINKENVSRLTMAWTYHSGDGKANIQCNPIEVDGVVFLPTAGNFLAAIDGATGKEIWRYQPEKRGGGLDDVPARRGLVYWPGDKDSAPRILFTMNAWLYALDPKTGKPLDSFGKNGRTRIPSGGCSVAPVVYKNVIVLPGFNTGVFAYDVRSGESLWAFHTLPSANEPGVETWGSEQRAGANDWGGAALDESRGIVYVATGSPKPNFLGYMHPGDNLFSDCVIALDALTGRYLWHFQEIRHDVWDLDIPAPPILVTVTHDGTKVDAVAQVTKIGNTLLLDRVSGKPLFPFRFQRVAGMRLPGDAGSPYEPAVELPQPFVRQQFTPDDVTQIDPAAHDAVMKRVAGANMGRFPPFEDGKWSVYFGIHGGAEWTGAAVDPQGRLFVTASELPWLEGVFQVAATGAATPDSPDVTAGKQVFATNCAMCHGAALQGNGMAPSLVGLGDRLDEKAFRSILHSGRNGMPAQPQLTEDQIKQLVAFLLKKGASSSDGAPVKSSGKFADRGYQRLLDPHNYPGCTPPWGTLTCLDLNTGKIAWKVPLGEYPELTAKGVPKTGQENFGGATVTAGGLVFASGTRDGKIRAFDADTGAELWKQDLPLYGTAPPAVYEAAGREFVVLAATGGGKLGGPTGDAWVAFALPQESR